MSDVYKTLSQLDVNGRAEKKNGLTYLSWSWAWAEVKKKFPDASYTVTHYDDKPYLFDENLGYMVATEVTICGETLPMHLPVMDHRNNAMKHVPYSFKTNRGETHVQAATMFDINKTVMRCLVKNLAMFGLGLYIYSGEDLPDVPVELIAKQQVIELENLIESKGYQIQQATQLWKINSLEEIQVQNYQSFVDNVNSWGNANAS